MFRNWKIRLRIMVVIACFLVLSYFGKALVYRTMNGIIGTISNLAAVQRPLTLVPLGILLSIVWTIGGKFLGILRSKLSEDANGFIDHGRDEGGYINQIFDHPCDLPAWKDAAIHVAITLARDQANIFEAR